MMKLKFLRKKRESGDVWSFFFEPAKPFEWTAGQSVRLEIPRKTWGYDERRFTIASAPYEKHLRITTRLSDSDFKQNLASLKSGNEIDGHGVEGSFVWGDSSRHRLLLAAGVGITPFRAMLSQAAHEGRRINASLIYNTKDAPPVFMNDFESLAAANKGLVIFITPERILLPDGQSDKDWLESLVYISGPEQMVRALADQALSAGLPPERLKTDLFTGYAGDTV